MDGLNVNVNTAAQEQWVKCPQCGASIEAGSKFCAHCGTQLPDDVQKAHVKIEDMAELKRLELEVKKLEMEKEQKKRKRRNRKIVCLIIALIGAALMLLSYKVGSAGGYLPGVIAIIAAIWMFLHDLFSGN